MYKPEREQLAKCPHGLKTEKKIIKKEPLKKMQAILVKLNDPTLSKEEILEIASETKRHDVLLRVMKAYPEKEDLILILAKKNLTMTDYEYARKHLRPGLVSKLKDIIFEKCLNLRYANCYSIRDVYGPDHSVTKSMERNEESLGSALHKYDKGKYMEGDIDDIIEYMRGTIKGARKVIEIMEDHPQWEDVYPDIYDDGDMLDMVLEYTEDLELAYEIAERIDPEEMDGSFIDSLSYYPDEHKLHMILANKNHDEKDTRRYIEYIEKKFPDRVDLLEILKKRYSQFF